ncbi:uncharacterized protein CCOS01_11698 [Colletotrichum costaricense]|uniref:Uncharacterized protein n=1 Tax=Colletotrichum costaricense TaxID=1209916 RepID=A0AAJ0DX48_9PEZI|nr:uncharacterized protein CCOS01_11698 [Colletotrichum costaricense]KAK1518878.1 hypothetical protein CCOS01_11698 [Colletotrichum costaricense]
MDEGWTAECGESFMIETRLRGMSSNRAVASKIPAANPPPSKASPSPALPCIVVRYVNEADWASSAFNGGDCTLRHTMDEVQDAPH